MKECMLMLIMPWLSFSQTTVNLEVVDQNGKPVEGADVRIGYNAKTSTGALAPAKHAAVKSDQRGRVSVDMTLKRWVDINDVQKDGYVYEPFLNPERHKLLIPNRATPGNPHRIVLRKRESSRSFCLACPHDGIYSNKGGAGEPIAVDLYAAVKSYVPDGMSCHGYCDFFVRPTFNADANRWTVSFWTTNECSGIIATTNRIFVAPETGYATRVEVDQESYANPAFTLYLKTRSPLVHVMIPFENSDQCVQTRKDDPYWRLSMPGSLTNPYGGRVFEYDERILRIGDELARDLSVECWRSLLVEHKYPSHPDLKARAENLNRRRSLEDEIGKCHRQSYELRKRIENLQKSHPKEGTEREIASLQKEMKSLEKTACKRVIELKRLKNDARALNLAEGVVSDVP